MGLPPDTHDCTGRGSNACARPFPTSATYKFLNIRARSPRRRPQNVSRHVTSADDNEYWPCGTI